MNNAAISAHRYIVRTYVFISFLGIRLGVELLGHMMSLFNLLNNGETVF